VTAAPSPASFREKEPALRLLVVDDEAPILRLLRNYLESRGCSVETASGGLPALELVRERSFDVVLLDLVMPDLDGVATLKQIKAEDENVSVLMMTGFGTVKSAIESLRSGADDFLLKPLSLEALGLIIERVREHRRLKSECQYLRARWAPWRMGA